MIMSNRRKLYHIKPTTLAPYLLFAHHDQNLRQWLTLRLREERYQVEEISGDLAAALGQYTPDLIVADIELFGEQEIERLTSLKKAGRLVPLVLMAGKHQKPVLTARAHRLGMVVFFKTPFETCDFLTAVGFLLDCSKATRLSVSNLALCRAS